MKHCGEAGARRLLTNMRTSVARAQCWLVNICSACEVSFRDPVLGFHLQDWYYSCIPLQQYTAVKTAVNNARRNGWHNIMSKLSSHALEILQLPPVLLQDSLQQYTAVMSLPLCITAPALGHIFGW